MNKWVARFWLIIALAFPVLEIAGIAFVWDRIGAWTLFWLAIAVPTGLGLIALERVAFLPLMAGTVLAGGHPLQALKSSGLRFLAGVLLIFPGFFSDALALLFLILSGFRRTPAPVARPESRPGQAANDEIIEGDYRRID
ncbi:MAG: FxsA family protein [Pseudomonadota bacterium]